VHRLATAEGLVDVRVEDAPVEDYLLGDPFARDVLLQATQLLVPQSHCLPVEIARLELHEPARTAGTLRVHMVNEGPSEGHENARIDALDPDGRVRERIVGFRARILERDSEQPTAEELADPGRRYSGVLRRALAEHARALHVRTPEVALTHLEGLHARTAEERRTLEQPLFDEVIARALGNGGEAE
jgi:hypothetical protein